MTKAMTVGVGLATLLLSWLGELSHSAFLAFFFDTRPTIAIVRASLVIIVCAYAFFSIVRNTITQLVMFALGLSLFYIAIASLFTAHFFGTGLSYYMLPIDIFLALEWGVITLLVAFEQPVVYDIDLAPVTTPVKVIFNSIKVQLVLTSQRTIQLVKRRLQSAGNRRPRAA